MIRRIAPAQRQLPIKSPLDMGALFADYENLRKLREDTLAAHDASREQMQQQHDRFLAALDEKMRTAESIIERAKLIEKGDKGEPGEKGETGDMPVVDHAQIARLAADLIPQPQTPVVDHVKIARIAATFIPPPPKPKDPVIDHEAIAEAVIKKITEDKKLSVKHLADFNEGLEQTMAPIRSLAAGFRGGGDTVAAGTNITITTVNGVKRISSTGGGAGFTKLTATGTVDGSNAAFTFTQKPAYVISDGAWYVENSGWTWNGGTLTATMSVPPQTGIFGFV